MYECCICFEELDNSDLLVICNRCKQILHKKCSEKCMNKCPLCRYSSPYNNDDYDLYIGAAITIQALMRGILVRNKI